MEKKKGKVKEVSESELKARLESKGDERRTEERVPARLEVELPLATWDEVRRVYTTNISKGGLLFTLTSPASVAASIDLTLSLPDGKKVSLQSEVRHVARRDGTADFDVGVQFQGLDAKTRAAFEEVLAKLSKKG